MTAQSNITPESIVADLRYLQLLSRSFPTIAAASTEIINLEAILNLPKGTEHFLTDIHGEYEAFQHVLKNASGAVKRKVNEIFGHTLREIEKKELCTLIYYPEEKLQLIKATETDIDDWYLITLNQLVKVCQNVSSKYTRSKVRKSLPAEFSYIIQELLHESTIEPNKHAYINVIISTIISTRRADDFIIAMCNLIQRLTIDSLHIVGDIYDRGPGAHIIMDTLCDYHNFDIQWGNHDILWMGAASGNEACMANVIRLSMRYGNLGTLEDGYGINLLPLATFAMDTYADDPCTIFAPKTNFADSTYNEKTLRLITQMHKAITIIQFKLEGQLLRRHKEFHMEDRCLLHRINPEKGTVTLADGKEYPMLDTEFPTIDWKHPYELTPGELDVMERLETAFRNCEKLQNHMRLLLDKGGLYKIYNGNLLFHGSIPLNEDGTFREVQIYGKSYKGKELYDVLETYVRRAFYSVGKEEQKKGRDIMWYIWAAPNSPLFGKSKMSTFERYFIEDPSTHEEKKNAYYRLWENEEVVDNMLREFGLDPEKGHIINGHVPVHQSEGESPVKCDGKVIVIDGGFSKPYQKVTGIAGYTLIYNSYGLNLTAHEPFTSKADAVARETDIVSNRVAVSYMSRRQLVGDTDTGHALKERIQELIQLLDAYRTGIIKEKK